MQEMVEAQRKGGASDRRDLFTQLVQMFGEEDAKDLTMDDLFGSKPSSSNLFDVS